MPAVPEQFHKVRYVSVTADQTGQRIDNFLMNLLKTVPRSLIYRLVRTGQVRVNKGRVKPSRKLKDGDIVRVPPVTQADDSVVHLPASLLKLTEQSVIHECDSWIVINKSHGLSVHGGSGVRFGVIDLARQVFQDTRISLVHRLDRATSGCLVLAKTRMASVHFQRALKDGQVKKNYVALLSGVLSDACRVDEPLRKAGESDTGVRMVQVDRENGNAALSHFRPRKCGARCSLVDIEIETGRTHQIRVHSSFIGHPVVGDDRYGDRAVNRWASSHDLKRMCLHAAAIEFPDMPEVSATDPLRFACAEESCWHEFAAMT